MQKEIDELKQRMADNEMKIHSLQVDLKANTDITSAVKEDTKDLVEFVRTLGGLAAFCKWFGRVLQWIAPIALVVVSAWAVIKGAKQP